MTIAERLSEIFGPRRLLRVVWPFAVLAVCLVLLASFSMELLSAARAYVGGEGLWSKAQKQAVYALNRYADSRREADFQSYLAAIAIPLGDHKARLELEKPEPDLAVVRAGFLEGRNDIEDIPGMIRLYRWFRHVDFMAKAIDIWAAADESILELAGVADTLRREVAGAAPDATRVAALLTAIDRINRRVTPLEDDFSFTLGEASRLARTLLSLVIALAAALMLTIAVLLTRNLLRQTAAFEQALRASEQRYALSVEGSHDGLWDWDIAGNKVYYSPRFMEMLGYAPGELALEEPKAYLGLLHPDDLPGALAALERHRDDRVAYDVDYRLRTRSGDYRWFHARGQTVRDRHGVPTRMAGSITDITERKLAEAALRAGEAQMRSILQAVPFPIVISTIATHEVVYTNDYALRQFKLARAEDAHQQPMALFVDSRDQATMLESLAAEGEIRMHEVQMRDAEGQPFWALVSAQPVTWGGQPCVLTGLYDITERKRRDDDIRRLAFRDTLTRLPNRASFDRNLTLALERAEASGKRLALLFVDLDQFKQINDTYGHKGGDRLLQAVAIRLANSVRKSDYVARLGGDEFVVILPEFADLESVAGLAAKLLARVAKPLAIEGETCMVTASIGIACFPDDGANRHTLLKHADIAMYRAKAEGKNTFRFHAAIAQFGGASGGRAELPADRQREPR